MNAPADSLADYLAGQGDIRLGIVFGSLASGKQTRDSDLDIAVLGERPLSAGRRKELIEALGQLSGRSDDIVDLATAGITVASSALLGGRVIFSRDGSAFPTALSRVLTDSTDFLPYRDRMLKERREAWIRQ